MNRLLLIICIFVSLTHEGARDTQTMAQRPPQLTSAEVKPCDASNAKDQPTLKRRQAIQNIPTADQDRNDQESSENPKCTHQLSEDEALNNQNPVRIEFEGLHAFTEADVLRAFREERVALPIDHLPSVDAIDKASTVLRNLLHSHGYMYATVSGLRVKEARAVKFVVNEGIRLPIAELLFEGNRIFSSEELAASLHRCLADYSEHTELGLEQQRPGRVPTSVGELYEESGIPADEVGRTQDCHHDKGVGDHRSCRRRCALSAGSYHN